MKPWELRILTDLIDEEIDWCKDHVVDWEKCSDVCNGQCDCAFVAGLRRARQTILKHNEPTGVTREFTTESLSTF